MLNAFSPGTGEAEAGVFLEFEAVFRAVGGTW